MPAQAFIVRKKTSKFFLTAELYCHVIDFKVLQTSSFKFTSWVW